MPIPIHGPIRSANCTQENIKPIVTALLIHFQSSAEILATLVSPDHPLELKDIPDTISHIQSSISSAQSATAASRISLAKEAVKVQDLHRQILETSIRILEQTIHGSVARGTKAKADYLTVVAEGMNKKLGVQHAQLVAQLYSSEVQEALDNKAEDTRAQSATLKRKIREAEEKLEEYKKNFEIAGMAKEYAEIVKESERLKEGIGKLESGG